MAAPSIITGIECMTIPSKKTKPQKYIRILWLCRQSKCR